MRRFSKQLAFLAATSIVAACSGGEEAGPAATSDDSLTAGTAMLPTSDVASSLVVGVGDTTKLFHDVDDGSSFASSDDSTTYVRGQAGVATSSHTVGYSGGPTGTVGSVTVSFRAMRGTAQGTAQVLLFDGATQIGAGAVHTAGSWTDYTDVFSNLSVSNAANLRTRVVFHNTAGTGALRYTQIWLNVVTTGAAQDAGTSDAAVASDGGGSGASGVVDATTMFHKHMVGYQGWHLAAGDGSPIGGWKHWFRTGTASATNLHVDLWPDTTELAASELFPTDFSASLYSAYTPATVARHFRWMQTYGIDGVYLQRFLNEVETTSGRAFRDRVTQNVMAGAEATGRVFTIMYDISGAQSTWVADLENDWKHLVNDLHVTSSSRFLRHGGKPIVAIWGIGFTDRPGTPCEAQAVIDWFEHGADNPAPVTLMGGVPTNWLTSSGDSKAGFGPPTAGSPSCLSSVGVYRSFDVISPWSVGRYKDDAGVDSFETAHLAPDLAAIGASRYVPVIWPGYSFHNASSGAQPLNQIPRRRGDFYWHQAYDALAAGSTMLYTAMFDEVDEGTAIYKMAASSADLPAAARSTLLYLNVDDPGNANPLKSDWYLKLTGEASRMLRGERPRSATMPTPY